MLRNACDGRAREYTLYTNVHANMESKNGAVKADAAARIPLGWLTGFALPSGAVPTTHCRPKVASRGESSMSGSKLRSADDPDGARVRPMNRHPD